MYLLLLAVWAHAADDPLLDALDTELTQTMEAWEGKERAPYFLAFRAVDQTRTSISARSGALAWSNERRSRDFDVQVRVGSPALDNTHPRRSRSFSSRNFYRGVDLPLDGDPRAVRAAVWSHTAEQVRKAQQAWLEVQANQRVKVEEEDKSGDFIPGEAIESLGERAALALDVSAWEDTLVAVSARLDAHEDVHANGISLTAERQDRYVLTSEGTRIRQPRTWVRVALRAETRAEDGMDLTLYRWLGRARCRGPPRPACPGGMGRMGWSRT